MDIRDKNKELLQLFQDVPELLAVLKGIEEKWQDPSYGLVHLYDKFMAFYKGEETISDRFKVLIQAAVELTTQEAPDWEYISARLLMLQFELGLKKS